MRKFRAEYVFDGRVMHQHAVLCCEDDGRVVDLLPAADDLDAVYVEGLLCPGFINAHCHLELSHMRDRIPQGTGLVDFLLQVMQNREASAEDMMQAMQQADADMLKYGIVAVGDIANRPDSLPVKLGSQLRYHTFVEALGALPDQAAAQYSRANEVLQAFARQHLSASLVPHAPYSVSEALLRLISHQESPVIQSIHNQESAAEDQLFRYGTGDFLRLFEWLHLPPHTVPRSGKSSLQTYLSVLNPQNRLILVHNTFSHREDLDLALRVLSEVYFCLCPGANRYIESRLPDLHLLMDFSDRIILGTDSLASNRHLSILEELKLLQEGYPDLNLSESLRWATWQGAKALGMDKHLGSFDRGKRPGVLQVSPLDFHAGPALAPDTQVIRLL